MIKLSERLQAIERYIDQNDVVIDVGCDHALLDIFLAQKYHKKYYASDLRKSALLIAEQNINKYRVSDYIELRCGFGLNTINNNDDINTVVISGMGYYTIVGILKDQYLYKNISKMIISSNTNPKFVREYMIKNGYYIEKETAVIEKNISYIITLYKKGHRIYKKIDIEVGLLENIETNKKYLNLEIKKNKILLSIIPKSSIIRRLNINYHIKLLQKKKDSMK